MSLNKVMLIGNLGKDPEIQTFDSGAKKAAFSIATTEKYTNRDGQKSESTEWHNIICWNKLADLAENYLRKGKQIYVEGKIKTRSWEEDGKKRYITEIEALSIQMLGQKGEGGGTDGGSGGYTNSSNNYNTPDTSKGKQTETPQPPIQDQDDLPF